MLKHHLTLFLRNIQKNKVPFFIKTAGLGVGIASFLILALYVYNDLTYDHFHENLANIYRVREGEVVQTKGLLLPKMLEEIPEVVGGTRIFDWDGQRLGYHDVAFFENVHYVDTGFFSMFTFPFTEGGATNPIGEKYGAVISRQMAEKYFGNQPALGKQLRVNFEDVFLTVKGVVDFPSNSSIKFDIVTSYETGEEIVPWIKDAHDWYNTFSITYVQLRDEVKPRDITNKLQRIVKENFLPEGENRTELNLLPFREYHSEVESNRTLIIFLAIIALGILGIALVNFINLTITDSLNRTREVGIKKVLGATRLHVVRQIITESLMSGLAALLLGIFLMELLLPAFNRLFETSLYFNPLGNPLFAYVLLVVWVGIGLISGWVPSLLWSRGDLVRKLQGKFLPGKKTGVSGYSSIIIQFVIAIILISGTFLIRKQITFMREKDPKFDRENVVTVQTDYWQFRDQQAASRNLELIYKELDSSPYIEEVSFSGIVPGVYQENYNTFYPEEKDNVENIHLRKAYVGENYFKTFGIPILSGSGFQKGNLSNEKTVVINKKAMEMLGITRAEGQLIREGSETGEAYRIVGVVDNFSYQGVQKDMQPLAHFFTERENTVDWDYLSVRSKPGARLQAIHLLQEKWKELLPEASLNYFLAEEKLNEYYQEYEKINKLIAWFSLLAIGLSCMGLYALSSYVTARRTKEIGIRKVNGATNGQILALLNKDFVKWVGIAFTMAVPISWYAMEQWLHGFAYKTTINWWIFALAGIIALLIALLTVSWQSFKAANANPVKSLRTE